MLGIVNPTDFHSFQRGRYTTNQIWYVKLLWHSFRAIPKFFVRRRVGRVVSLAAHGWHSRRLKVRFQSPSMPITRCSGLGMFFLGNGHLYSNFPKVFFGGRCTLTKDNFHMRGTLVGSFLTRVTLQFTYCPTNPEFSGRFSLNQVAVQCGFRRDQRDLQLSMSSEPSIPKLHIQQRQLHVPRPPQRVELAQLEM